MTWRAISSSLKYKQNASGKGKRKWQKNKAKIWWPQSSTFDEKHVPIDPGSTGNPKQDLNKKRTTPRPIRIKLLEPRDKEKTLKAAAEKRCMAYRKIQCR